MRGYWNDDDATAHAFDKSEADDDDERGWLISGDLGFLDADGNLSLVGRLGEMYIRGGYNVYPVEVENVLVEHPAITAVAIVGEPKPMIGEIGVAYVVVTPGMVPATLEAVRVWVRERLADYKAPDELVFLDALPLTAMGKVDKVALRR